MAMKEIAVQGMTLGYSSPITGSAPTVVGIPSIKVKAESKGVYKDTLAVLVPVGITDAANCVSTAPFPTTIVATAQKTKADGTFVLRVDDESAQLSIPGLIGGSSACTISTKVVIDDAGQTKVTGE